MWKLGELRETYCDSYGNPQPSRRMKYADGRFRDQDKPRIEMKSTSAQPERDEMVRSLRETVSDAEKDSVKHE